MPETSLFPELERCLEKALCTPLKSKSNADTDLCECLDPDFSTPLEATPVPLPFAKGSKAADRVAFVVENLLSPAECEALLKLSTDRGYEAALVNVGGGAQLRMDDVRRSGRCMIDSTGFAEIIYRRLAPLLPASLDAGRGKRGTAAGLNERFRFLRYTPGDYFAPHRDGSYPRPMGHPNFGDRSFLTCMLYLDAPAEGGETNFINDSGDVTRVTAVAPSPGLCLVFEHELCHEGALVKQGTKHCVRTDVMYRLVTRDSALPR